MTRNLCTYENDRYAFCNAIRVHLADSYVHPLNDHLSAHFMQPGPCMQVIPKQVSVNNRILKQFYDNLTSLHAEPNARTDGFVAHGFITP